MAPFNPSPGQPNDPNYLNYSQAVKGPDLQGNTYMGDILKTIGSSIKEGVAAVDTSIKKGIQDKATAAIDKERDQFTTALETTKAQLDNGQIAPAVKSAGGSTAGSVLDDNDEPEVPAGLQNGLGRINQLSQARASGSIKINDTQYAGQVLAIAKQLRSQYGTGYREFIDDTVSKASGLPVANSYYQNLMLDINRQLNQRAAQKDEVGQLMLRNLDVPGRRDPSNPDAPIPNMGAYYVMRQNGDPKYPGDSFIIQKIADWQNLQTTQKVDAARRAEKKDLNSDDVDAQKASFSKISNGIVSHFIEDNLKLSGLPDFRSLYNYMSQVQGGNRMADTTEIQQRAMQLQTYRQYIYNELYKSSVGYRGTVGDKVIDEQIAAALSPIDGYIKMVNDEKTGAAYFSLNQAKAIKADDERNWLLDKDVGAANRRLLTARGTLGEQYFPEYLRSMMNAGLDKKYADLFNEEALKSVAPSFDERGNPIPRDIVDAVQHAKRVSTPKNPIPPDYYGTLSGWLEQIADPNMPMLAKDRIIQWGFNRPKLTDELNMDYRDPKTGKWVEGKYRALNLMTSDTIMQAVGETAKAKPENYAKAKNWTETEFGKLYREDLQTLNGIMQKGYLGAHFGYDDVSKHFILLDKNNKEIKYNERALGVEQPNQVYLNSMVDILTKVNSGTDALKRVYKYNPHGDTGGSVDKYLLQTLQTAGFRPGELTGAPAEMAKALMKTLKPDATPEELNKLILGK